MKTIKVYVAGKVRPDSNLGPNWREEFCEKIGNLCGTTIINVDCTSRKALPFDARMVFGRDCFLISKSDLVIVNLTDDTSVGASQEMIIAKYFNKPLIGIAKEGGKFINKQYNDFGRIVDYVHPFVLATCDAVVRDEAEAAEWIRQHYGKEKPKGIECIEDSIRYYLENYFDKDEFAKKNLGD